MLLRSVLRAPPLKSHAVGVDKLCRAFGLSRISGKSCHSNHYATQVITGHHQLLLPNRKSHEVGIIGSNPAPALLLNVGSNRWISVGKGLSQENKNAEADAEEEAVAEGEESPEAKPEIPVKDDRRRGDATPEGRHLNKDRRERIPVETSIRYMKSSAYQKTYGENPVWFHYRRNFPGQFAPKKTRKMCIRMGKLTSGNPCPICRDEYLVLDYRNVDLLKQFISPHNGEVLGWDKTGICRNNQRRLLIEIDRAKDYGLITFDVPFREYDYDEYKTMYNSGSQ